MVGVFSEISWPPATQFVLALIFGGSLSNSWRKANAYPEYVVPKSIAATTRLPVPDLPADFDVAIVLRTKKETNNYNVSRLHEYINLYIA